MKKVIALLVILGLLSLVVILPANSKPVLKLTENNTALLNGPVDNMSVTYVIARMRALDEILPKGEPIYLLLNTPGGDVIAGMDIVNFAQSLDRPVHTITLFAASMGFVIAQNLNVRYILQNGILMSHRMKTGMNTSEVGGELDEALKFATAIADEISKVCAERLGMSLKNYKERISDEWWLFGQHAVDNKAADEVVTVSCSKGLIEMRSCPF